MVEGVAAAGGAGAGCSSVHEGLKSDGWGGFGSDEYDDMYVQKFIKSLFASFSYSMYDTAPTATATGRTRIAPTAPTTAP